MFSLAKRLFTSSLATDHYFSLAGNINEGLRILNVENESIGYQMGFESWFDYILSLNGFEVRQLANKDFSKFVEMVVANIDNGRDLVFTVWSAKGGTIRQISVPFTTYSNNDADETESLEEIKLDDNSNVARFSKYKKLGISVQLTSLETATYVWHVLDTLPNSPGHSANLLPGSDYIIGAQDGLLAMGGEELLGQTLYSVYSTNRENATLVLYVYNQIHNVVRPVTIYPNRNWGGIGLLGCDVGYGFLHRIPEVKSEAQNQIAATGPIKQSFTLSSNNSAETELSQLTKRELTSLDGKAVSSESSDTITDSQLHQFSDDLTDNLKNQLKIDESSKHEDIPMPPSIAKVSTKIQLDCPISNDSNPLIATPYHARKKRHRHKVDLAEHIDEQKESLKEGPYNNNVLIPASPRILNRG
ncbi:Acetylated cis-Golgi protein [Komagataella phaffii CBS 7435]|uniref:Acetylated, cis-golgi localized protein involved in ER to Golgi transport n=2 Tax=Komagataella phaffii TaxID=460519 RepID=C4R963_KOMPG|nr:Acetylated, cis-golgi localized protein involved in ER to Golgi transport [Komagataella phaffii GS115]AOA64582.1 GQ67_05263T0 [Komagataella phaffii]CAH2450452.1 Acetylated cis-Golgi protein [Komagataella phaffii CBS 7435]AOA69842.1 GQ68_05245T0 [Komagataella phaffii GS115]CAY72138.1 Acetylated, cis-golgi localized protein involved in ER to Golgi transport [Komagataella phaffii GS115]CCA40259.1 Acetylated cis-Golgi protein [Komagataella phaffii CBS 7435]